MANRSQSSEKIKRIVLIALAGVLAIVFVYQLFFSGPARRPARNPQVAATTDDTTLRATTPAPSAPKARQPSAASEQEALLQAQLSDLTPLNLGKIRDAGVGSQPGGRGNIFAYVPPPPPVEKKPPPPPPIQLVSLQPQTAVAGTPRPITLVVSAQKIPADAQILFNGSPKPTKRLSEMQLSTEISPGEYANEQNINVEVRSQSDASQNSNIIPFVVQRAPDPQFIYKGRLGSLGQPQYNYAVFEFISTKEIKRAKVGDTLMGIWRIDAISADAVDVTHTQYDIKKRVTLQDKVR